MDASELYLGWFFLGLLTNEGGWQMTPILKSKICHTYPTMMKLGSYNLHREDSKDI